MCLFRPRSGFTLIILSIVVSACQSSPKKLSQVQQLTLNQEAYLNEMKQRVGFKNSFPEDSFGYILYDPTHHKVLAKHNETLAFIPASTTKVLTHIVALKVLGPQFKFITEVAYAGKIYNGILYGDLYLKGEGDPTLTASHIMSLASTVSRNSIHKITGNFYYDESAVIPQIMIRDVGDASSSFNPGLGALSFDFNQFTINWRTNKNSSSMTDVILTPDLPLLSVTLSTDPSAQDQTFKYEQKNSTDQWSISPHLPSEGEEHLPIRHPSLYTALLFSKFCKMNQLSLPDPKPATLEKERKILASHSSSPLLEISERALEFSNNMMTELISLATAKKLAGKPVSIARAAILLKNWLSHSIEPSSQWDSLFLVNGSGLTSYNRISPSQLLAALKYVDQFRFNERDFESLLPISGWKGTLSNRLGMPESAFQVWAKTGTLFYSNALTGYLYTLQGKRLIFAMMFSDLKERKVVDQLGDSIPSAVEAKANLWMRNARQAQEEIIRNWIILN